MLGDQALLMVAVHLKGAECHQGQGSVHQAGIAIIFRNFTQCTWKCYVESEDKAFSKLLPAGGKGLLKTATNVLAIQSTKHIDPLSLSHGLSLKKFMPKLLFNSFNLEKSYRCTPNTFSATILALLAKFHNFYDCLFFT